MADPETPPTPDPLAHLSAAPLSPAVAVVQFIEWVDRLLDDEDCQFAATTLEGLRASAKGRDTVTEAMRDAVANIEEGARRGGHAKHHGGGSRRYEGYGGSGDSAWRSRRRW